MKKNSFLSHCELPEAVKQSHWINWRRWIASSLALLAMTAIISTSSFAGKLGQFEKSLGQTKSTSSSSSSGGSTRKVDQETSSNSEPGKATDSLKGSILQTLMGIFLVGMFETAQEDDFGYAYKYLKDNESPALPTFRLEGGYQYLAGKEQAVSGRVEAGYLMIGAEGEYKRFWEKAPDDELNVASGHVLLRALFSDVFQINLALGEKVIWGDMRHDGFELGFPFYMIFGKHIMWDVRPYLAFIGGHEVYDFSSGISYKYKMFGVRGGYRGMNVENTTLHGPEVGLFMQW